MLGIFLIPQRIFSKNRSHDAQYRRNRVFIKPMVQAEMHLSRDVHEEQGETRNKLEEKCGTSKVSDYKKSVPLKDQIDIHVRESDVPTIAPTSALFTRSCRS